MDIVVTYTELLEKSCEKELRIGIATLKIRNEGSQTSGFLPLLPGHSLLTCGRVKSHEWVI